MHRNLAPIGAVAGGRDVHGDSGVLQDRAQQSLAMVVPFLKGIRSRDERSQRTYIHPKGFHFLAPGSTGNAALCQARFASVTPVEKGVRPLFQHADWRALLTGTRWRPGDRRWQGCIAFSPHSLTCLV